MLVTVTVQSIDAPVAEQILVVLRSGPFGLSLPVTLIAEQILVLFDAFVSGSEATFCVDTPDIQFEKLPPAGIVKSKNTDSDALAASEILAVQLIGTPLITWGPGVQLKGIVPPLPM
ncbi:MAG: hypothetical protein Q7L07_04940 [Pseudohongiella sp.]|nr:hypothetical protein [Pseudohongiella sp.]